MEAAVLSAATTPQNARDIAVACIVAGTVLFLVFVAYKMSLRVSLGCCGHQDPEAAELKAVLASAAHLYQASTHVKKMPASVTRRLTTPSVASLAAGRGAGVLQPPTNTSPEIQAISAGWSLASTPGAHGLQCSNGGMGSMVPAKTLSPVQPASLTAAAGEPSGQLPVHHSPQPNRWPRVRDLVRAWAAHRSGASNSGQAAGSAAVSAADLESQQDLEGQEVHLDGRALTWSQLGVPSASPTPPLSRRVSENAAPLPPPPHRHTMPHVLPAGELGLHTNPVFSDFDWAGLQPTSDAAPTSHSFTAGIRHSPMRRPPSRMSRSHSFVDMPSRSSAPAPAPAASSSAKAEGRASPGHRSPSHSPSHSHSHSWQGSLLSPASTALQYSMMGEGSTHGGQRSRRGSPLHPGGGWEKLGAAGGGGGAMHTRHSEQSLQSLLHPACEIEGLECINE